MCKSSAEGGQRCIGHATQKMVKAQERYESALTTAHATEGKGGHALFMRKACAAFDKFDSARHEYASTPQGEEDLRNRLSAALDGRAADTGARTPDGKPLDNPVDLEVAIMTGRLMRTRNENRRARNAATRPPATSRASSQPSNGRSVNGLRMDPAPYVPTTPGEIVRISKGTPDRLGTAYLPEGAYVRYRDTVQGGVLDGRVVLVERVRMPGDKGEDEFDAGYGRSMNGSYYEVPISAIGACPAGDPTAEHFTANPDASGDDYTGDEYLDQDYETDPFTDEPFYAQTA